MGQPVDAPETFSLVHFDIAYLWQPTVHAGPSDPAVFGYDSTSIAPFFGIGGMVPHAAVEA